MAGLVLVDPFHEGFVDWLQEHQPEPGRFREECLRAYASDWEGCRDLWAARPGGNQGVVLLTAGHRGIRRGVP